MTIARQPFEVATEAHIEQAYVQVRSTLQPHVNQFRQRLQTRLGQADDPSEVNSVELHAWMRDPNGGNVGGLIHVVRGAVGRFANDARGAVEQGQRAAIDAGNADAAQQMHAAVAPIAPIAEAAGVAPDELVRTVRADASYGLIGNTVSGGPLRRLFDAMPEDAANGMYTSLLSGLRAGVNPTQMAFDMMLWGASTRARALTIARTEMLGAYRTAQLENFRANSDVVEQWMWSATTGACALCTDMDGELFDLDISQDSHPCCRCACVPVTRSYDDILSSFGIDTSDMDLPDDTSIVNDYTPLKETFADQSPEYQDSILGKAAGAAYRAGDVTLDDFVGISADGRLYQRSLKDMGIDWRDYASS